MRRKPVALPALTVAFFAALAHLHPGITRADDTPIQRPAGITPPGRSLAGTDDSDAIALDPAQIAFMPSWELRYTHVQLPKDSTALTPGRGDAVGLAIPLFFGLATGVRFESVRPPRDAPLPSYSSLSWTLAWRLGAAMSIAFDVRRWGSDDLNALDGATSLSFGVASRPWRHVGVAVVARDLNAPRGHVVAPDARISRSFDFGLAVRPLGTRAIEVGLETRLYGSSLPGQTAWVPRGTLGVDIPGFGRAVGAFQVADPRNDFGGSWAITAGVEVGFATSRIGGGVVAGKGLGGSSPGWYGTASLGGFVQPGIREPERAVTIRLESTPGARGHVALLRKLARLERDPAIAAIAIIAKSEPASSSAHAEELDDAIKSLRARGKHVLCHFEDAGGRGLLSCAHADRILLHPAGGVRFAGFRTQTMYFGEALHKIGIEPDFLRIREHKTAPEGYVRSGPTPVAAQDQREFLDGIESVYLARIGDGRRLPPATVKANVAKGPFIADEAIAAGFADAKAFDDEVKKHVREVVGRAVRVEEEGSAPKAAESFGPRPHIAIVYIDGDIVDGRSQRIPLLGERLVGSYTIAEALKDARQDPSVKGVVLRIESPGGSSLASDVMWREAELLVKEKPVVVSMGSVAASGGYYAAAFGAPIYASRATVTGSIGIFYGKADVSPLLKKLGIHVYTQRTAPKADAESFYRPFTDEERVELARKVGQFYAVFLDRVSRGRKMTIDQVDAVGRGKVWLGGQAKERGLVDVVGGIDDAMRALRRELDLPDDTPVSELPVEKGGLLDLVLGFIGGEAAPSVAALPKALAPFAKALAPFVVFAPDQPLALWEGIEAP